MRPTPRPGAGYTERNPEGVRIHKDTGKALEFTIAYGSPSFTRIHRVVAEDLMKVGIKMNLEQVDYNAQMRRVSDRKFTLHYQSWRGLVFPNPLTSWHSDIADLPANNNMGGFKNQRVDALMEEYDVEFERARQIAIIQEIDRLIFKEYPMALGWFGPFERVLYWNRFGTPDTYLTRVGDQNDAWSAWWYDPVKARALEDAMAAGTSLPVGEEIVDPWGVKARLDQPTEQ